MSDARYRGKKILWRFADENEREQYLHMRGWRLGKAVPAVFATVAFPLTLFWALTGHVSPAPAAIASMFFLWSVAVWWLEVKHPIHSIELSLSATSIRITEIRASPFVRRVGAWARQANLVKSMQWVSNGCRVAGREVLPHDRPVLIPNGLFQTEADLEALYAWAEKIGVTIEGPRPLPGAYARPVTK